MNRDNLNGSSRDEKLSEVSLPLYCDECSRQCKGGARKRNCVVCSRLTANRDDQLVPKDGGSTNTPTQCVDLNYLDFNSSSNDSTNVVASCSGVSNYSDSAGYRKNTFVNDSDSSDNDEADKFCVYTYKGLDVTSQNEKNHQNRDSSAQRSSSSEMDYLEMDFDPGTSNGHDYCDDSGQSVSSGQCFFQDTNECFISDCNACDANCLSHPIPLSEETCAKTNDSSDVPERVEEYIDEFTQFNTDSEAVASCSNVKTGFECRNICLNSHVSGNESSTSDGANSEHSYLTSVSKADDITPDSSEFINVLEPLLDNINFDNEEAFTSQINLPSVKAMSIRGKNILSINPSEEFSEFLMENLESYQELVSREPEDSSLKQTRKRSIDGTFTDTQLQDFLLFLLSGNPTYAAYIDTISKNYFARWFPTYPPRNINLCKFILHWISRGAVPILTFMNNVHDQEKLSCEWSHKLVEGSNQQFVLFKGTINFESEEDLTSRLSVAPSTRVPREQIMALYNYSSDLRLLSDFENNTLQKYNVLGQVANVIRESFVWNDKSTRFITLPSKFLPGISIVIDKCNSYVAELKDFPDLPVLSEN